MVVVDSTEIFSVPLTDLLSDMSQKRDLLSDCDGLSYHEV